MKSLLIFALVVLISCDDDQPPIDDAPVKCPDNKVKIGEDVCAIVAYDSSSKSYFTYVKKKSCGKNKACIKKKENYNKDNKQNDIIYTCQKKLNLLKIGKKCNYNAECYTGSCSGGKCTVYGDETCYGDENCGPDKYCDDDNGGTNKCVAYVGEGVSCKNGEKCAPGYSCDSLATEPKCKKYYTLEVGDDSENEELCKSFAVYNNKCIEVVEVNSKDCSLKYKDKDGKEQTVTADESNKNILGDYDNGELEKCRYGYRPQKLKDDIIKRYGKIKLNKLTEKKKENCAYGGDGLCDQKYSELITVNDAYDLLLEQGLIKENGEKNKDKKCEYEFFKSMISSSYVSVCFGFVLALLGLLF